MAHASFSQDGTSWFWVTAAADGENVITSLALIEI